ncbi:uncharacterized transposon-derived protein F54H12.3 [Trichonephila clavipes]|nr:uncharacterized transposon-derived protein F54H12.3 [Trichonephila clavipes]
MDLLGRDQKIAGKAVLEDVEKLKKLYYNPKEPASFGGVKRLSDASGLKKTRVRKFLSGEDPYTLHFPVRYKFQRRKTIAYGVNELWQSDLVDLQKISRFNRGYRYLLTIIDVMSRYLRAFFFRSKTKKLVRSLKFSTKFLKSHGFAPANVTEADEPQLYKLLYKIDSPIRFRFAVNDVVRISKARKVFRKGYLPGWTEETFIIYKRYPTNPPTYVLQDLSGKEIAGRFYTEELQKKLISPTMICGQLKKLFAKKGRGTSRQLFVKWVGFDDSFNSWIKAEWLKT